MSESSFKEKLVQEADVQTQDGTKVFFLRRGNGTFPTDLAAKIAQLKISKVLWMAQSESDGNISLTMIYE